MVHLGLVEKGKPVPLDSPARDSVSIQNVFMVGYASGPLASLGEQVGFFSRTDFFCTDNPTMMPRILNVVLSRGHASLTAFRFYDFVPSMEVIFINSIVLSILRNVRNCEDGVCVHAVQ